MHTIRLLPLLASLLFAGASARAEDDHAEALATLDAFMAAFNARDITAFEG